MGQGTITGGGTDGLYTVTLDYGTALRDNTIVRIIAQMGEIAAALLAVQALLDAQQLVEDAALAAAEAAIDDYVAATQAVPPAAQAEADAAQALADLSVDPTATPEQLSAAQAALVAARAALSAAQKEIKTRLDAYTAAALALVAEKGNTAPLRLNLQTLQIMQTDAERALSYWEGLTLTEEIAAWCADLTEDATGAVATIEIPGENALVLIAPAAPAPVPATDGLLSAREVQSAPQAYFNAAILPGWQKHKPTYRRGVITAIDQDADTADVTLTADLSSAQGLEINQSATLAGVPVQYMECHAGAFEVGDACVVKFTAQDWSQPKVVGFVDNPKSCGPALRGVQASSTSLTGAAVPLPSSSWLVRYGAPMPVAPKPVATVDQHPGHITWVSPHFVLAGSPVELSWRGPDDRYSTATGWSTTTGGTITPPPNKTGAPVTYTDSPKVWINGRMVSTGIDKVIACALHRPNPLLVDQVVLRVCSDSYPQFLGIRRMVTFDLVPQGATGAVPLADIVAATAFVILATYPATTFSTTANLPVTGTWITRQRPHFNNLGDRLAACIAWRDVPIADDAPRIVAAALDPVTWAVLQSYGVDGLLTNALTASTVFTYVPTSDPPLVETATVSYIRTTVLQRNVLLAVDFLDDALAYVTLAYTFTQTRTADSSGTLTAGTESWSEPRQTVLQVSHSAHGLLASRSFTADFSGVVGAADDGSKSISQSGPDLALSWTNTHLVGDISRDAFAIGLPVPAVQGISYSGAASSDSSLIFATDVPATFTREVVNYDVFLDGALAVAGTNGSYAMAANAPFVANISISSPFPTAMILADSGQAMSSSSSISQPDKFGDMAKFGGTDPLHKHAGVHPARGTAYLGVGLRFDFGGLELVAVRPLASSPPGSAVEVQAVPAYIAGAGPTITAPVFAYRRTPA